MSAQPASNGSLSRAQQRIADLLDELNATVAEVDALTRSGQHEAAIRLVDDQRAALYRTVGNLADDVAVRPRRFPRVTRHAAVAAAAMLAVSTIASVGALRASEPVNAADAARAALTKAESIADPVARLDALAQAVAMSKRVPDAAAERGQLDRDLSAALADVEDEIKRSDPHHESGALTRARELAEAYGDPTHPTAPQTDPKDPGETVVELIGPGSDANA